MDDDNKSYRFGRMVQKMVGDVSDLSDVSDAGEIDEKARVSETSDDDPRESE